MFYHIFLDLFCILLYALRLLSILIGLIMYARYQACDPLTFKNNLKVDELVSFFIMDIAKKRPGISGLFAAGVLSAGLSTISSILNSFASVIYYDFVCKFSKKSFSSEASRIILILIVAAEGLISIGVSYVFKYVNGMFALVFGVTGMLNGPMLGLVTLGILCPKANRKVRCIFFYNFIIYVMAGRILWCSLISYGYGTYTPIPFPSMYHQNLGMIVYPMKPLSTNKCHSNFSMNTTHIE